MIPIETGTNIMITDLLYDNYPWKGSDKLSGEISQVFTQLHFENASIKNENTDLNIVSPTSFANQSNTPHTLFATANAVEIITRKMHILTDFWNTMSTDEQLKILTNSAITSKGKLDSKFLNSFTSKNGMETIQSLFLYRTNVIGTHLEQQLRTTADAVKSLWLQNCCYITKSLQNNNIAHNFIEENTVLSLPQQDTGNTLEHNNTSVLCENKYIQSSPLPSVTRSSTSPPSQSVLDLSYSVNQNNIVEGSTSIEYINDEEWEYSNKSGRAKKSSKPKHHGKNAIPSPSLMTMTNAIGNDELARVQAIISTSASSNNVIKPKNDEKTVKENMNRIPSDSALFWSKIGTHANTSKSVPMNSPFYVKDNELSTTKSMVEITQKSDLPEISTSHVSQDLKDLGPVEEGTSSTNSTTTSNTVLDFRNEHFLHTSSNNQLSSIPQQDHLFNAPSSTLQLQAPFQVPNFSQVPQLMSPSINVPPVVPFFQPPTTFLYPMQGPMYPLLQPTLPLPLPYTPVVLPVATNGLPFQSFQNTQSISMRRQESVSESLVTIPLDFLLHNSIDNNLSAPFTFSSEKQSSDTDNREPNEADVLEWLEMQLHLELLKFQVWCSAHAHMRRISELRTVFTLGKLVLEHLPGARVNIFGSFQTGLAIPSSDVDVLITLPPLPPAIGAAGPPISKSAAAAAVAHFGSTNNVLDGGGRPFSLLTNALRQQSWIESVNAIPTALVPIIKTVAKITSTHTNVNPVFVPEFLSKGIRMALDKFYEHRRKELEQAHDHKMKNVSSTTQKNDLFDQNPLRSKSQISTITSAHFPAGLAVSTTKTPQNILSQDASHSYDASTIMKNSGTNNNMFAPIGVRSQSEALHIDESSLISSTNTNSNLHMKTGSTNSTENSSNTNFSPRSLRSVLQRFDDSISARQNSFQNSISEYDNYSTALDNFQTYDDEYEDSSLRLKNAKTSATDPSSSTQNSLEDTSKMNQNSLVPLGNGTAPNSPFRESNSTKTYEQYENFASKSSNAISSPNSTNIRQRRRSTTEVGGSNRTGLLSPSSPIPGFSISNTAPLSPLLTASAESISVGPNISSEANPILRRSVSANSTTPNVALPTSILPSRKQPVTADDLLSELSSTIKNKNTLALVTSTTSDTLFNGTSPVRLDITFGTPSHRGLASTAYTRAALMDRPVLAPLILFLKELLHGSGLGDAYTGGLSSFGLLLLVEAFLAQEEKNPTDELVRSKSYMNFVSSTNAENTQSNNTMVFADGNNATLDTNSNFQINEVNSSIDSLKLVNEQILSLRTNKVLNNGSLVKVSSPTRSQIFYDKVLQKVKNISPRAMSPHTTFSIPDPSPSINGYAYYAMLGLGFCGCGLLPMWMRPHSEAANTITSLYAATQWSRNNSQASKNILKQVDPILTAAIETSKVSALSFLSDEIPPLSPLQPA
jgi:Nucleotidyltransferase domain